jgi:hypothetical protein
LAIHGGISPAFQTVSCFLIVKAWWFKEYRAFLRASKVWNNLWYSMGRSDWRWWGKDGHSI